VSLLGLSFGTGSRPLRSVLCVGAHCDDIEIGCGGTLLSLLSQNSELRVHWVVLSSTPVRAAEAQRSAERFLVDARHTEIIVKDFRTSFFPFMGEAIKDFFETLKERVSPDLILTHTRHDLHQDHRVVCELTWNTFRQHLILEYEIPKYDGDLGRPNMYVPVSAEQVERKIEYLLEYFPSQRDKHWFTRDMFLALMRIRGMESIAPSGLAEAFYCRKARLACAPDGD
jgi:LmbE family N-acetylglucosaminyl deacetylase